MSSGPCPPIEALIEPPEAGSAVAQHLASCPACAGVAAVCSLRSGDAAETSCSEWEPVVAAMSEGTIDDETIGELASHLRGCPRCTETLATMSLLGDELVHLPNAADTLTPAKMGSSFAGG